MDKELQITNLWITFWGCMVIANVSTIFGKGVTWVAWLICALVCFVVILKEINSLEKGK